jgi:hypothetical protein
MCVLVCVRVRACVCVCARARACVQASVPPGSVGFEEDMIREKIYEIQETNALRQKVSR